MAFKGACVHFSAGGSISVPDGVFGGSYTPCIFAPTAAYDTDGFYDAVNRDRMVIPAHLDGAWVKVHSSVRWKQNEGLLVQIFPSYFNAAGNTEHFSAYVECDPDNRRAIFGTTTDHGSITMPKQVFAGDYFRSLLWQCNTPTPPPGTPWPALPGPNILALAGSLSIEVVG